MTVGEALRWGEARLNAAGVPDAAVDAAVLLEAVTQQPQLSLRLNRSQAIDEPAAKAYAALVARRAKREPLQYIVGRASFMGFDFAVDPSVLIPRQDTETLCEAALSRLRGSMRILDIGTGSGALAISLKLLRPACAVTALDISPDALQTAKANAARLGAAVDFRLSDGFSAVRGERFDVILSNPPYVSPEEMERLMPEVRREPELALWGGEDGLSFYRRLIAEAPDYLNPGGTLLFEIGWQQREAVCRLLEERFGGEAFALRDLGGNWRVCGIQGQINRPEGDEKAHDGKA